MIYYQGFINLYVILSVVVYSFFKCIIVIIVFKRYEQFYEKYALYKYYIIIVWISPW